MLPGHNFTFFSSQTLSPFEADVMSLNSPIPHKTRNVGMGVPRAFLSKLIAPQGRRP